MKTIKIFIASSAELSEDREEVREMLSVENDRLHARGIYLQLVQWEYFLDAVSEDRLQNDYNDAIAACDIVLSLFYTKAGKYTQEEFQVAYTRFLATGRPFIYTYFKSLPNIDGVTLAATASLTAFKDYLGTIGHFYTVYDSVADLKYKLKLQLDLLLDEHFPDEVADTELPKRGVLLYKVPEKMQLQVLHRCLIRVAFDKETLLEALPDYAADYVLRPEVRMGETMEVIMVENEAFEVVAINSESQAVEEGDFTEWNFDVRPLKLGNFPLTFRVSVMLNDRPKEVVLTESVEVVVGPVKDALEFRTAGVVSLDDGTATFGPSSGKDQLEEASPPLDDNLEDAPPPKDDLEDAPPPSDDDGDIPKEDLDSPVTQPLPKKERPGGGVRSGTDGDLPIELEGNAETVGPVVENMTNGDPEVTDPEVTDPVVTDPEVTDPEVTDPKVTDPKVTDPEVTDPEVTDPEVTDPVTLPSTDTPDIQQPINMTPQHWPFRRKAWFMGIASMVLLGIILLGYNQFSGGMQAEDHRPEKIRYTRKHGQEMTQDSMFTAEWMVSDSMASALRGNDTIRLSLLQLDTQGLAGDTILVDVRLEDGRLEHKVLIAK
jgi:hypothetical protein